MAKGGDHSASKGEKGGTNAGKGSGHGDPEDICRALAQARGLSSFASFRWAARKAHARLASNEVHPRTLSGGLASLD